MVTISTVGSYNTHERYSVDFFGEQFSVTVTDTPSVISEWIRNIFLNRCLFSHPLVVGVGVQWTPSSYHSDHPTNSYYDDRADILQLCVGNECIIIQLGYCNFIPNDLRNFLIDEENTFVGIWNSQDARMLGESCHQLEIGELLDIRKYVTDSWGRSMRSCSFEEIVEECLGYQGVGLDPEISMSDWSVYGLDFDQICQASVDVFVCSKLGVEARLWEI